MDVSDGGAEYFTVPLSNIWGTTLDLVDRTGSLNKAQSVANEDGTYTYVISAPDPGVANWIDSDGLNEAILDVADGRIRRGRTEGGPGRARSGRETRRPGFRSADAALGSPRRNGRPSSPTAARRIYAGYPKGRSDGPLVDHRVLDRYRPRDRPRCTGSRPQRRRDGTKAGSRRRLRRRVRGPRARAAPRRDRPDQIIAAVTATEAAFGGIDVLVNNAGYGYMSAVEEGDDAEVRRLFDTNYFGVVDTLKAVLPAMRARKSGHVINISSMTGLVANPPERLLLVDQVRPRGVDRGAVEGGRTARYQGDGHRARCIPHRLGRPVDAGVVHSHRRLRRERGHP